MKKLLLYICLLTCGVAQAAKVQVSWVNPSTYTTGAPLTDLSHIIIEWGTCNGTAFGVMQSSRLIATTEAGKPMSTFVYPTGMTKVCIRAQAFIMTGGASVYSNVASKNLLPTPGKPVTLGKPVILSFNQEKDNG